jgi:multiple sugar transport system substrate-binding protein
MSKMNRRELLRRMAAAGAGLAATLAGCQPKTVIVEKVVKETVEVEKEVQIVPTDVTGELRIGTINDPNVNGVMDILLAGFGARYPDVKTKIEYQIGDYSERMYTQAAAGTLPDVVWTANLFTLGFVSNNVLKDLMPFIDVDTEFDLEDIYPVILSEARIEGDPGLYYLPASLDVVAMYYNKTMLEEAGAELPTSDWTWDDFIEAGLKVTAEKDADGNPTQWMLDNATWSWTATVHPWLVGYGGDVLDAEGRKSTWSSPESLAGLKAYAELWTEHKIAQPLGADVGGQAFTLGRAATYFHIPGLRKHFRETIADKFEWEAELAPKMPDGKHRTGMGSYGFGIFAGAARPNLAWDFVKYLNMPTAQLIMARNMAGMPVLRSLANDERWLSYLTAPPTNHNIFVDAANDGVFSRTFPLECGGFYTGLVNQTYTAALEAVLREQREVEEAFVEADAKIQACLDEHA